MDCRHENIQNSKKLWGNLGIERYLLTYYFKRYQNISIKDQLLIQEITLKFQF